MTRWGSLREGWESRGVDGGAVGDPGSRRGDRVSVGLGECEWSQGPSDVPYVHQQRPSEHQGVDRVTFPVRRFRGRDEGGDGVSRTPVSGGVGVSPETDDPVVLGWEVVGSVWRVLRTTGRGLVRST